MSLPNGLYGVSAARALASLDKIAIVDGEAGKPAYVSLKTVSAQAEETAKLMDEIAAAEYDRIGQFFAPAKPRPYSDGKGKRLVPGRVQEDEGVWAPFGIERLGAYRAFGTVPAGAVGKVVKVLPNAVVQVRLDDPDTGERFEGDCFTSELRYLPAKTQEEAR